MSTPGSDGDMGSAATQRALATLMARFNPGRDLFRASRQATGRTGRMPRRRQPAAVMALGRTRLTAPW